MQFYLVGIKGAALGALAKILNAFGHIVSGVDVLEDFYTSRDFLGIKVENFENMNLKKHYYYIIGNAYRDHDITRYLQNMGYKYDFYPVFLNKYFKDKKWICVAGTHGKTTTTKLIAEILGDVTALIGDGSYRVGKSPYFVLEACEYRDTFLNYHPDISLILNVDYDHVDYFKTKKDYDDSFVKFVNQSKIAIVDGDEFQYRLSNMITYGQGAANQIKYVYESSVVRILNKSFTMPMAGSKFAADFVGAYLVAKLLNINDLQIIRRLLPFRMPKRRYQKTITANQIVILDYAHHPNEIAATLEAVKEEYEDKKIIAVFEPHTNSRLEAFKLEFKKVLSKFDEVYLAEVFTSIREKNDPLLIEKIYAYLNYPLFDFHSRLKLFQEINCVICFMGAGAIDCIYDKYLEGN